MILIFFYRGSIYNLTYNKSVIFRVTKLSDLNEVIIPHFNKYSLLSRKKITFILWKNCVELMSLGLHKLEKGLHEVLSLYASIGRGASKKVMKDFPFLIPAEKPICTKPMLELSEYWLSGYFSIYCNFNVDVNPHGLKESYYNRVVPSFNFSRNIEELFLMELLASYSEVIPNIRSNNLRVDVNVYGLDKLNRIVDLFTMFPLHSLKQKEFIIWSKIIIKLISLSNIPNHLRLSLDYYIYVFYKLVEELNNIINENNSK